MSLCVIILVAQVENLDLEGSNVVAARISSKQATGYKSESSAFEPRQNLDTMDLASPRLSSTRDSWRPIPTTSLIGGVFSSVILNATDITVALGELL
jgi:hypothetical protein